MNGQQVTDLIKEMFIIAVQLSLPLLGVALIIGLLVSVFQAATQINEATLAFLPKIAAMILILVLMTPWMIRTMTDYTKNLYGKIPAVVRMK